MAARNSRAKINALISVIILLAAMGLSCSGSAPMLPSVAQDSQGTVGDTPNTRNARTPGAVTNRAPWGVYTMILDRETWTIEVIDNRNLATHMNVKSILQSDWWCPAHNCIKIQFLEIDDVNYLYKIKGTLVNPTWFSGYDVRAIIFYDEDKEHDLLNADDYTRLYEPGDFINPFRSFCKPVDQRKFGNFASNSEIFDLYVPPAPKKFLINFAIDASWPTNCEEPYDLENFGYEGSIFPDDPGLDGTDQGAGLVFSEVFDWQANIAEVTLDTTPITGGITTLEYNTDNNRYEAPIADLTDAPPGDYVCLLAAYSEDDPTLGLFNYLTIHVDETPPPAVQTIFGHVGDSFTLNDLDGTMISVVNQDPLGFVPEPAVVLNGDYTVNVTTGVFNISVVPLDGIHQEWVCTDVVVTTDEDVHMDFGLHNPAQTDPYDPYGDLVNWTQIAGFYGRVVNEAGEPIPGATIEVTSPESWGLTYEGQDFMQAEITDADGYFSLLNLTHETINIFGSMFINTYHLFVSTDGYEKVDLGLYPATPGASAYQVITMTATGDTPIWTEDFESDTGWTFTGYYHRQQYDPLIQNICFSPSYNFLVLPPDEICAGSIPPTVNGTYYLWYGQEIYGNFLGSFDPGQGPYSGGISSMAHSGYSVSPIIDLTAYTTARLEFDMCYEIESNIPANFDEMRVWVTVGGYDNLLRFMNTFVDPGPIPYPVSMRGYFRAPIWIHYVYDISAYAGNTVNVKFTFSTDDMNYNGGRGQFIDNVKVYAE